MVEVFFLHKRHTQKLQFYTHDTKWYAFQNRQNYVRHFCIDSTFGDWNDMSLFWMMRVMIVFHVCVNTEVYNDAKTPRSTIERPISLDVLLSACCRIDFLLRLVIVSCVIVNASN